MRIVWSIGTIITANHVWPFIPRLRLPNSICSRSAYVIVQIPWIGWIYFLTIFPVWWITSTVKELAASAAPLSALQAD